MFVLRSISFLCFFLCFLYNFACNGLSKNWQASVIWRTLVAKSCTHDALDNYFSKPACSWKWYIYGGKEFIWKNLAEKWSIIWSQDSVFLYDSHSWNADKFDDPNEHTAVLKFGCYFFKQLYQNIMWEQFQYFVWNSTICCPLELKSWKIWKKKIE